MPTNSTPKSPERLEAELVASQFELEQASKRRDRLVRTWWVIVGILGLFTLIGLWQLFAG